MDSIKLKFLAPGRYAIDVEPIPPCNRNNREVHLDYLKHLKESVKTLREIVEEAKVDRPLDTSLASACLYTKHSQELLEYVIGTCPKDFNKRDEKHATTPLTRKKQVCEIVAFCLLEDLTAFCLKISLRFASRPHCVLLQDIHCVLLEDLTAFCLKTSLRFASRPHCVLLQVITAFCFNITAFCSRPPLRFA
ncbi:hypothetical protein Tco_0704956 [Tanacetum coccineum]|uniref:Uncharacterized protein n=1 Tax=Tanacetum coccineum TaxID=301880 RepID=A0ABQ4Y504_9ASTR